METSVLIVDDSGFSRKLIRRIVPSEWHANIFEADNGIKALEVWQENKIDVMFLDLTMPEMNGFEVLKEIRTNPSQCKVFIISADIQEGAEVLCKELGASEFIPKPVSPEKFYEAFENHGLI